MENPGNPLTPLLAQLTDTVAGTVFYYRQLANAESEASQGTAGWGAKEVLAHYLFWHEWTCDNVEAVLAGLPAHGTGGAVDEVNALAIVRHADKDLVSLVDELEALQRRLLTGYQRLSDPNIVVGYRTKGPPISATERLELMLAHFRSHQEELPSKY